MNLKNLSKTLFIVLVFFTNSNSMNGFRSGLSRAKSNVESVSKYLNYIRPRAGAPVLNLRSRLQRVTNKLPKKENSSIEKKLEVPKSENQKPDNPKFEAEEKGLFDSLKSNKKKVIAGLVVSSACLLQKDAISTVCASDLCVCTDKLNLDQKHLFNILKGYKTTNTCFHAGDLFEHSVWVAQCVDKWFEEEETWVEGLSESDRNLAIISGFLHDIGKAGDLECVYHDKPMHPHDGFLYLLGKKVFYVTENKLFNFDYMFKKLNINENDRKLIAILVGIHWDFGGIVVRGVHEGKSRNYVFKSFLKKLQQLVNEADYNNGVIDERLLRMAILINAADLKGASPVDHCCATVTLPNCDRKYDARDMYEIYSMGGIGKVLREELITFYRFNNN